MMKSIIIIISFLFIILTPVQTVISQNNISLNGVIIDSGQFGTLPGVQVEAFSGKVILNETHTSLENGSFYLTTNETIDKIKFSYSFYYPTIIENINNIEEKELNLGTIKLFANLISFTRYITKEAEREGRKEEKRQFKKLKKGIIINSDGRSYKMRLKKKRGEFAFFINYDDFKNE